jgi:Fibronectin type III domain
VAETRTGHRAEHAETRTRAEAAPKGGGKKYAGLTGMQWGIVGVVTIAGIGFILWRNSRKKTAAASASASATTTTSTAQPTGSCDDGSTVECGGLCPDGTSPSGCSSITNSTLQTELGDLESQLAQGGGGSGGGGYYTGSGGTPATTAAPAAPAAATTAKTTTSTAAKAGAISNLQASGVGKTTAKVAWNKAANATSYSYKVMPAADYPSGPVTKSGTVTGTSVSLSGLKSGTTYNFGVQGLPGGPGDNIHFTTT